MTDTATRQGPSAEDERRVVASAPTGLFVGGEWRDAGGRARRRFAVDDPSTGEVLAEVADAGPDDAVEASGIAADAQRSWAATPPRERGEILRRAHEAMVARADDLALLMTLEMGKPLAESVAEVRYAAEFFRWFAEEAVRVDGGYATAPAGGSRMLTMRQPVGPCLLITPWNFPLAMGTRKIGPAVAAGCTMLVKPAHQTPLSMLTLAQLLADAGLPRGVLSVLPTSHAGALTEPLFAEARLRKVSFTGSTAVGKTLMRQAAEQVLRISLELGGNAPFLVFADADLDQAVEAVVTAKMRNVGEACTAANRIYADEAVADELVERLTDRLAALHVGRGSDLATEVGPLIDDAGRDKVRRLVGDALERGARVRTGGDVVGDRGFFYAPTVLDRVPHDAQLSREEIFGPVAAVSTFASEAEAIHLANDTEYGLVSYICTRDFERALRVCERLESGMIGLNQGMVSNPAAPFGGVKQSGLGREGGSVGMDEYLEWKYVAFPVRDA